MNKGKGIRRACQALDDKSRVSQSRDAQVIRKAKDGEILLCDETASVEGIQALIQYVSHCLPAVLGRGRGKA